MRNLALALILLVALPASAQTVIMGANQRKVFTPAAGGTLSLNQHFDKAGIDKGRGGSTTGGNARIHQLDPTNFPHGVTTGSLIILGGAWVDAPTTGNGYPRTCTTPCESTWTDNGTGNTYNRVFTISACRDANGIDHNIYYAQNFTPNATAGTPTKITETHPAKISNSYWNISNWYNAATTSALDSSSCRTGQTPANNTAPNITGTAITIAGANEGVYVEIDDNSNSGINPVSSTTVPSGCTALGSNPYQGHWEMICFPSAGSFTPTFTVAQTSHDTFTIYAAAFKSGAGGTAPSTGTGKASILTQSQVPFGGALTRTFTPGCPTTTTGVIVTDDVNDITSTGMSDSLGSSFTGIASGGTLGNGSGSAVWRALGVTISNPNTYTVTITTANANVSLISVLCTTASSLDTSVTAGSGNTQVNTSSVLNTQTFSATPATGGTASNLPTFTPGSGGDLFIGIGSMGSGPWLDCSTSGCVDDFSLPVTITTCASGTTAGECGGDADDYGNGDTAFHFWQSGTAQVNLSHVGNPSQSDTIMVVGFK